MLEKVEGNTPVLVQCDNLAVQQRAGWQLFARLLNVRELVREEVSASRPQRHSA